MGTVRPPPAGLTWVFSDVPAPGQLRQVAPGVHWLRMPLPFDLDHINLWVLDDGDGCVLVDTGAAAPVTRACWDGLLAAGRLARPVTRILVTHFHPDHLGLVRCLARETGAPVWMSDLTRSQCEELLAPALTPDASAIREFCRRHEVAHPAEFGDFFTGALYRDVVDGMVAVHESVHDGATLRIGGHAWHAIMTGGHAEGHVVLHCPSLNLLIAGDQVLPTITSNVSKFLDESRAQNPLGNYLGSFDRLAGLPEDVLVLPSHGRVFRGLHARMAQLQEHHARTLAQVMDACRQPRTTGMLVRHLFPQVSGGLNGMLAFGETRAHVVHLRDTGLLAEEEAGERVVYCATRA